MEQSCDLPQPFFGDVAEPGHPPWGPAGCDVKKGVVILSVVVDEGRILAVFAQH